MHIYVSVHVCIVGGRVEREACTREEEEKNLIWKGDITALKPVAVSLPLRYPISSFPSFPLPPSIYPFISP